MFSRSSLHEPANHHIRKLKTVHHTTTTSPLQFSISPKFNNISTHTCRARQIWHSFVPKILHELQRCKIRRRRQYWKVPIPAKNHRPTSSTPTNNHWVWLITFGKIFSQFITPEGSRLRRIDSSTSAHKKCSNWSTLKKYYELRHLSSTFVKICYDTTSHSSLLPNIMNGNIFHTLIISHVPTLPCFRLNNHQQIKNHRWNKSQSNASLKTSAFADLSVVML